MRIQLILLTLLLSLNAHAFNDKSIKDLFKKYDLIMHQKKFDLIDEVFTQKFLKESGGKNEFISKVKTLPLDKNKRPTDMKWRKGVRSEIYFVGPKNPGKEAHGSEFIVVKDAEKLKIDGTISDTN